MKIKLKPAYSALILLATFWFCDCSPRQALPEEANVFKRSYLQVETEDANGDPKCGYDSCPKTDPKRLNVHIIAHTHDDVGWLKTVDQYYYGTKKRYSGASVQYILDSVVPQLLIDSSKRFIYVEMSFFSKWWNEQDETMRKMVRFLVNEGRLEFINGGWCMNDEATVTYHSTIEQMTLGLKFLNETFGACGRPTVGWQIDPFGHTNEQASLFAQFGFDGMFFTRMGFSEKLKRTQNKSLDLIWHGDRILQGQSGSIFTSIFRDGYDAPNGYCFDSLCLDDSIVDNENSYEYNVKEKGDNIITFIRDYAASRLTNHVTIPFGGDFQFSAAGQNFKSLDKLIKYVRQNAPDIHIFYSTPSCYQYAIFQATANDNKLRLPEKYSDFMPYDSTATIWWSGYFSSRPAVKLVERETADLLQVARMISVMELLNPSTRHRRSSGWVETVKAHEAKCLKNLWEISGDLQHHDAVTGTEKQHVADDYVRRASDASKLCAKFIGGLKREKMNSVLHSAHEYETLKKSAKKFLVDPIYLEETMFCPLLNISQCDPLESDVNVLRLMNSTHKNHQVNHGGHPLPHLKASAIPKELETKGVLMTVYNPLTKPINHTDIRLPCNGRCETDKIQIIHVATNKSMSLLRLPAPAGVANLPFRDATTNYEILFYADLPPLGSSSFVITDSNNDDIVDEESYADDAILITDDSSKHANTVRSRRIRRNLPEVSPRYEYFTIPVSSDSVSGNSRMKREAGGSGQSDRVVVKFDMHSGVIVGLKRASDGSSINITQKFGYYFAEKHGPHPGAYIFRPNSSEPILLNKPSSFKMYKRQNGALIEIHQKWKDWIWQTIRVDARKNYIEFDYVVGPVPVNSEQSGREVVTRYQTSMPNKGIFLTDSGARQLLPRRRMASQQANELGGSFYPIVSTIMLRNNDPMKSNKSAESISILVDRSQAGTSLNEGDLELLIHRRHLRDDNWGVGEALDEPGEDGRGLVTRGKHRLFLKFQDQPSDAQRQKSKSNILVLPKTPRENVTFELDIAQSSSNLEGGRVDLETSIVSDQLLNDIRQESVKYALKPILTFDRLRVSAHEFMRMLTSGHNSHIKEDTSLLNSTLPNNIHLLTLQPWDGGANQILMRFENLDNPLILHPTHGLDAHSSLLNAYKAIKSNQSTQVDGSDPCFIEQYLRTDFDVEYLVNHIRLVSLDELNLGANNRMADDKRLDWTQEQGIGECQFSEKPTTITLRPRQIRTFLATFEHV